MKLVSAVVEYDAQKKPQASKMNCEGFHVLGREVWQACCILSASCRVRRIRTFSRWRSSGLTEPESLAEK